MNNNIPFVYLYSNYPTVGNNVQNDFERISNKLERLEKNIRIINNRLIKLENNYNNNEKTTENNINDMYII